MNFAAAGCEQRRVDLIKLRNFPGRDAQGEITQRRVFDRGVEKAFVVSENRVALRMALDVARARETISTEHFAVVDHDLNRATVGQRHFDASRTAGFPEWRL